MKIKINNIESYRSPESTSFTVDDRQQIIELLNGTTVQDAGRFRSGDRYSATALFSRENFNAIVALWENRVLVTFTDEAGLVHTNVRIKVLSYKYESRFPDYILVTFEIWNI